MPTLDLDYTSDDERLPSDTFGRRPVRLSDEQPEEE